MPSAISSRSIRASLGREPLRCRLAIGQFTLASRLGQEAKQDSLEVDLGYIERHGPRVMIDDISADSA